jgi:hypothetical protein
MLLISLQKTRRHAVNNPRRNKPIAFRSLNAKLLVSKFAAGPGAK